MHTRRIDIELRIRDVLRVLRSTSKIEDAGVELKGTPPSPETKAGQLAGAANASGGDPIVWVFGIADDGSFVDIAGFDFDQWFAKIPSLRQLSFFSHDQVGRKKGAGLAVVTKC